MNYLTKALPVILTLVSGASFGQDLENAYKSRQMGASLEKAALEKAKSQGPRFACPYAGTFTFVDGFVFDGETDLMSLGNYVDKGNGVIAFSWSQIDRWDNSRMSVIAELNTKTKVLYKVFKRANPARDDNAILPVDCTQKR